jgi:hypothetical protein
MQERITAANTKIAAICFCWATKEFRNQKVSEQVTGQKLQPSLRNAGVSNWLQFFI